MKFIGMFLRLFGSVIKTAIVLVICSNHRLGFADSMDSLRHWVEMQDIGHNGIRSESESHFSFNHLRESQKAFHNTI